MTFLPMKALLIVLLLIKMQPMNDIKTNAESCFDLSGYLIMYDLTLSQLFNGSIFKLNEYFVWPIFLSAIIKKNKIQKIIGKKIMSEKND